MEINFDILEQFRQYYDGEMSAATEKDLEQKIASDELYAFHHRAFRTLSKGVEHAVSLPDKEWMRDLEKNPLSESETLNLEKMIADDRAAYLRRIFLFIALAVFVLVGIALLVSKPWQPSQLDKKGEKQINPNTPVVEKHLEDEMPVTTTGVAITQSVPSFVFDIRQQPATMQKTNQVIQLNSQVAEGLACEVQSDTLLIFSDDIDKIKPLSFSLITLTSTTGEEKFLKMDTSFYTMPPAPGWQPLTPVTDQQKLGLLKKLTGLEGFR